MRSPGVNFDELEGTGANGGLAGIEVGRAGALGVLLGDDHDGGDVVRHQRIDGRRADMNGVVVDLGDGLALGDDERRRAVRHVAGARRR